MAGRLSYRRTAHLKHLVQNMLQMYSVGCYFCGEPLWEADPLKLTVHHINGDHEDDRPENKAIAHRSCHKKHHADIILHNGNGKLGATK